MTKTSKRNLLLAFCAATCLTVGLSAISTQTASATGTTAGATEFFMDNGASVRVVEGESGIRWTTRVDETWYNDVTADATTVEFHTLVTATDNVTSVEELVVGADASKEIKDLKAEVEVADVAFDNYDTDGDGAADSTTKVFTYYGSIVYDNLTEDQTKAYATELIARSYISVDGTIYYATAADTARDMRAVALAASEDEEKFAKFDEDEQDIVKGYFGAKETDVDLTSAEADEKAYCFEATNTVTASTASDYAVAYLGAKRIGTVADDTVTLDSAKMTLGDSYALTVFDADGNYAKVESFKYVTAAFDTASELQTEFCNEGGTAVEKTGYYVITANIDMTDANYTTITAVTCNWTSRGLYMTLAGTFDGQGHTISNLIFNPGYRTSNGGTSDNRSTGGFFGTLDGATIKDIAYTNVTSLKAGACGAIAACVGAGRASLDNVYVSWSANTDFANFATKGGFVGTMETTGSRLLVNNCVVVMPTVENPVQGEISGTHGLVVATNGRYDKELTIRLTNCTFIGGNGQLTGFRTDYATDMGDGNSHNDSVVINQTDVDVITLADAATYDKSGWSAMQIAAWNADNA
ncbi:MAG: hypothetical protein IJA89_03410 [Clostridia bacterium]|nr:hypothetical protein [Clostridia bacterium]